MLVVMTVETDDMKRQTHDAVQDDKPDEEQFDRVSTPTMTAVLNDDYARTIVRETSDEPKRARKLAEICDCSRQTVYRRLDQLTTVGLVEKSTRCHSDGYHCQVYSASATEVTVQLNADGLATRLG